MAKLRGFSDQATPVFAEFRAGGPAIARATRALGPFADATRAGADQPRHRGRAEQAAARSTPTRSCASAATWRSRRRRAPSASADLLANLRETGFHEQFMRFLYQHDRRRSTATTSTATSSAPACADHGLHGLSRLDLESAATPTSARGQRARRSRAKAQLGRRRRPSGSDRESCKRGARLGAGSSGPAASAGERRPAARRPGRPAGGGTSLDATARQPAGAVARRRARPARHDDRPAGSVEHGGRAVTRRRAGVIAASPVLVGAITTLIVILAVFLAYNANNGLPFVPTYRISVQVPNANTLVKGNDVRIGGVRVGLVESIEPVQDPETGAVHAKVDLKLDKSVDPLPKDSTVIVRSRSALGLKYLEINKGTSSEGYAEGSTLPLEAAHPEPVEIDQFLNIFDAADPDRRRRQNLVAFGDALAGRGPGPERGPRRAAPAGQPPGAGGSQPRLAEDRARALLPRACRHARPRWRRSPRPRPRCSSPSTPPSAPSPRWRARSSRSRSRRRRPPSTR